MNNITTPKLKDIIASEIQNYFEILDSKWEWIDWFMRVIETQIDQARRDERIEATKEHIKLADKMELWHETEVQEWRAFKGFRNALTDELNSISSL